MDWQIICRKRMSKVIYILGWINLHIFYVWLSLHTQHFLSLLRANQHTAWHAKIFVLIEIPQYLQSTLWGMKTTTTTTSDFTYIPFMINLQSVGPITIIINKSDIEFKRPAPPFERVKMLLILVWYAKC